MDFYISDDTYDRLIKTLITLKPCPWSGEVTASQAIEALGEIGGIWPASIEMNTKQGIGIDVGGGS